jgi:hypothetical protein
LKKFKQHWPPAWTLEDCRQLLYRMGLDWSDFDWWQEFPEPYQNHWVCRSNTTNHLMFKPYDWEIKSRWQAPKLTYAP